VVTVSFLSAMLFVVYRTYSVDEISLDSILKILKSENIPVPYMHEGSFCKLDADKLMNQLANKEIQFDRAEALYWTIKKNYDVLQTTEYFPLTKPKSLAEEAYEAGLRALERIEQSVPLEK
jgi:hypothetical protein